MHEAKLVWVTPGGDDMVAYIARVSNPANQDNKETAPRLIRYLIDHKHWSPFEMINACVEISTTRDVGRQILRHRSFTFQEFSGRYAEYSALLREHDCRLQDRKNRQNSIEGVDPKIRAWFDELVADIAFRSEQIYEAFVEEGIAKEVARCVLPEGLVPTRMYMNGTIRSWIHYCNERTAEGVQKEHQILAESIKAQVFDAIPNIKEAIWPKS